MRVEPVAEVLGQAYSLELRIVGHFDDLWVLQIGKHSVREVFTTRHVHGVHRTVIIGVREQQDLKLIGIGIPVHAGLGQRDGTVRLNVDAEDRLHFNHLAKCRLQHKPQAAHSIL